MLTVCLNGARPLSDHPRLSADPAALAAEAAAAIAAGADDVHVHPKSPDGADSLLAAHVGACVTAIRAACPGVGVSVTTGAWSEPDPHARAAAIAEWSVLPDLASVNWHEDGADDVAAALLERGVGVEAGIWDVEGLAAWLESPVRERCSRVLVELPDVSAVKAETIALRLLPDARRAEPSLPVQLHGEGASAWPALRLAAAWRLDTRVGLEDCLALPNGRPADGNAALVGAARRILGAAKR